MADPSGTSTAIALSAEYLAREDVKTTARYELRIAPHETTNLYAVGGAYKLSRDISLLGRGSFWTSARDQGTDTIFDGEIGGAYRPLGRNALYLLGVVRFKVDSRGSSPTGDETKNAIVSLEFSKRIRSSLTVRGKYAGKMSWESINGTSFSSYTDLFLAGATCDITDRWDVSVDGKAMNQYQTGTSSLGGMASVGYRVVKNVRVAAGYNFARLNDRDLAGEGYQSHGPYLQVKFKFDEGTLDELYRKFLGTSSAAATPSLPAPPAADPDPSGEDDPCRGAGGGPRQFRGPEPHDQRPGDDAGETGQCRPLRGEAVGAGPGLRGSVNSNLS